MAEYYTHVNVLFAHQADALKYLPTVRRVFGEANKTLRSLQPVRFDVYNWEQNAYRSRGEAQKLINESLVAQADIVLAVFESRLGTPWNGYESGTDEEIHIAAANGYHDVWIYFSETGYEAAADNEKERLKEYKTSLCKESFFYSDFRGEEVLVKSLQNQITSYIKTMNMHLAEQPFIDMHSAEQDLALRSAEQDLMTCREAVQKIKNTISQSRYWVAKKSNTEMLKLHYNVGRYISVNTRAGKWGTGAIENISEQLQGELPGLHGFSPSNMKNMRTFFEQWSPELEPNLQLGSVDLHDDSDSALNLQILSGDLEISKTDAFYTVGFSHHLEILRKCKTSDERWYYVMHCANEFWSLMNLKNHLSADDYASYGSMPSNFVRTIPQSAAIAQRSFRDEYFLNFIDIKESDDYDERDVENAIVANIKKFIMTAGDGFAFIGNQYRILIDGEEFFVDMLFFNRNLQCLVAFELKKDKFRPADAGQLSFYLTALDKYIRKPNENKTIGILLCQEMNRTVVELAVQDYEKPMGVATYRLGTDIPPEQYESLVPLINGVQQIVMENGECDG
ncbi:MAG: PDDEXK nuclease domain-containing protein [Clostridiales Family XIII bacterium]|jgi:predicted nuclease of restriction endonuclease-like (RecB) superfamily|nr:PDDEXK nuclease domain-containing protein [Clostridiales Family XIII bacterium]